MADTTVGADAAGARLCAQADLDAMCPTGIELVHEAIDSRDPALARATYDRVVEARRGLIDLMNDWVATTLRYLGEQHGAASVVGALEPDRWLELGQRTGLTLEQTVLGKDVLAGRGDAAQRLQALVAAGDGAGAKDLWDAVEAATLKLHDYRIDWLTAVISHVYRTHGADALADALRLCAETDWWHDRMTGDLALLADPLQRVANWSFFLGVRNWGTVSVTETDGAFVIHHQVCGSCGRQELRRMHPRRLPARDRAAPRTQLRRSQLHDLPHPPGGLALRDADRRRRAPVAGDQLLGRSRTCWFTVYKDPRDTPAWYYERAGLTKPA